MPQFVVEIKGANELARKFDAVTDGIKDLNKLGVWDDVQTAFYEIERDQFASEGNAARAKWKALSPAYAAQKLKRFGQKPILQATGKLYRSLTQANAEGSVVNKMPQELVIGSSIPHGIYHQTGTNKMPARPPIEIRMPSQKEKLLKPMREKLLDLIKKNGFGNGSRP